MSHKIKKSFSCFILLVVQLLASENYHEMASPKNTSQKYMVWCKKIAIASGVCIGTFIAWIIYLKYNGAQINDLYSLALTLPASYGFCMGLLQVSPDYTKKIARILTFDMIPPSIFMISIGFSWATTKTSCPLKTFISKFNIMTNYRKKNIHIRNVLLANSDEPIF